MSQVGYEQLPPLTRLEITEPALRYGAGCQLVLGLLHGRGHSAAEKPGHQFLPLVFHFGRHQSAKRLYELPL